MLIERLRRLPRERDLLCRGIRCIISLIVRAWLKVYHRFSIVGLENLPADGSFVLVANHASHLDTLCLQAALPLRKLHRTFPAAAADYFFVSLPRTAVAVLVANAMPFHRHSHLRESLMRCRQLLARQGNILILYPEGTRSTDGRVASFRPGIGTLVAGTAVPVVPCYLEGAGRALAKGNWFPRPRGIRLVIGRPRRYPSVVQDKAGIRFICADLERAVRELNPELSNVEESCLPKCLSNNLLGSRLPA